MSDDSNANQSFDSGRSSASSRSPTPEISVAPPTPGAELDLFAVVGKISSEKEPLVQTSAKDEIRKRTGMGGPSAQDIAYLLLSENKATAKLRGLAASNLSENGTLHTTSLQPHPDPEKHTQDRYYAEQWDLRENGIWKLRAVFDGHAAGDETVDYVFSTLPRKIKAVLGALSPSELCNVDTVSSLLRDAVSSVDESIKQELLDLFPSPEDIAKLSDDDIRAIVNDQFSSSDEIRSDDLDVTVPSSTGSPTTVSKKYVRRGLNNMKVTRAMRGTTVLIVLISPEGGIWTVSLGDCQAGEQSKISVPFDAYRGKFITVLGQKIDSEPAWTTTVLSVNHNASEPSEISRLELEHPDEEGSVIVNNRVLGLIAVTRAIGDFQFKLPSIYTDRIFSLTTPGMDRPAQNIKLMIERNTTPPYVSGVPEVGYVKLEKGAQAFLIMCSDGLLDLYGGESWQDDQVQVTDLAKDLVDLVGAKLDSLSSVDVQYAQVQENLALYLIRRGLRGPTRTSKSVKSQWTEEEALNRMSGLLTLEDKDKWMDDTTVLVDIF